MASFSYVSWHLFLWHLSYVSWHLSLAHGVFSYVSWHLFLCSNTSKHATAEVGTFSVWHYCCYCCSCRLRTYTNNATSLDAGMHRHACGRMSAPCVHSPEGVSPAVASHPLTHAVVKAFCNCNHDMHAMPPLVGTHAWPSHPCAGCCTSTVCFEHAGTHGMRQGPPPTPLAATQPTHSEAARRRGRQRRAACMC